jgi:hypothetical protein
MLGAGPLRFQPNFSSERADKTGVPLAEAAAATTVMSRPAFALLRGHRQSDDDDAEL